MARAQGIYQYAKIGFPAAFTGVIIETIYFPNLIIPFAAMAGLFTTTTYYTYRILRYNAQPIEAFNAFFAGIFGLFALPIIFFTRYRDKEYDEIPTPSRPLTAKIVKLGPVIFLLLFSFSPLILFSWQESSTNQQVFDDPDDNVPAEQYTTDGITIIPPTSWEQDTLDDSQVNFNGIEANISRFYVHKDHNIGVQVLSTTSPYTHNTFYSNQTLINAMLNQMQAKAQNTALTQIDSADVLTYNSTVHNQYAGSVHILITDQQAHYLIFISEPGFDQTYHYYAEFLNNVEYSP